MIADEDFPRHAAERIGRADAFVVGRLVATGPWSEPHEDGLRGASIMTRKAARAKAAWMAMLATHRRPWPEWAELERRVHEREFVTHSIGPRAFLFSGAAADEPPLSRQIASSGAPVPEVAPPFPRWIAALVGLGCQGAGDLASAGALASELWRSNDVRAMVTLEDCEAAWHYGPLPEPRRDRLFALQSNRSGTLLFSDGATVQGFVHETRTLEKLAELEVFSRFCLRHSLRGEDWVVAWRRGDGASEGIRPLAEF
jgi:hypothetical protein